jgi:hypothetical protein
MKTARIAIAAAALLLPVALTACPHHHDDDAPSATPAPTPTPTPTPTPSMTLTPEVDAGPPPPVDAGVDAAHPVGISNLQKCCNAIKQNAKSAPPEQQLMYQAAIAVCASGAVPVQFRSMAQCK